jgi:hypothetical protein
MLKQSVIFIHRWLGVALCVIFLLWFPSGIGMMYWDFPSVSEADRLERSPALDSSTIRISPADAYARLGDDRPPDNTQLTTFDGRPVYVFGGLGGNAMVYADTGDEQNVVSDAMLARIASAWTGQPASAAKVEAVEQVDQWTLQGEFQNLSPLRKYSWPNGEQVYISENTGEVAQYTTMASRLGAYVGAIPHWLYFTPLRKHGLEWSRLVIWSSGIGTASAILGIAIGIWMYSPSKRYRYAGAPTSIPYRGQKRWHAILGLVFGIGAATWAFSGMLSMDPFPIQTGGPTGGRNGNAGESIPEALRGPVQLAAFAAKHPREALAQVAGVKQLELTSFAGEPVYLASLGRSDTRIIPLDGEPRTEFDRQRIVDVVRKAVETDGGAEFSVLEQYDRYYLDRRRQRPLPVILARLNDADQARYYIDPKTARVVGNYNPRNWVNRWLYHGLHSLDFPWLYNYRPLWDIVVITFMVGGTALCVTSLILAWRVLGRTLRRLPIGAVRGPSLSEDLAPDAQR